MTSMLIITGTMGASKTAVLAEPSDLLSQRQIVHAAIDLHGLGLAQSTPCSPPRRREVRPPSG